MEAIAAADRSAGAFLETPAAVPATASDSGEGLVDSRFDLVGARFGPYLLTGVIGSGGMGTVYRAVRDDEFQMQAAVKVINRGAESSMKR